MSKFRIFSAFLLILVSIFSSCDSPTDLNSGTPKENNSTIQKMTEVDPSQIPVETGITTEDLAYHWAPVHYQDTFDVKGDQSRVDYITRIDRGPNGEEGAEWNLKNNYDKDLRYP